MKTIWFTLWIGVFAGCRADTAKPDGHHYTVTGLGVEMVHIEGGTFLMGSEGGKPDEKPVHRVTISKPFWLSKYEITQNPFREFCDSAPYKTLSEQQGWAQKFSKGWQSVKGGSFRNMSAGEDRPATCLSWDDCVAFGKWLTEREEQAGRLLEGYEYRLPTEAEWEFAARGGNQSQGHVYSGSHLIESVAWYKENADMTTHAVGQKQANALGLYDMCGNVWEWCLDQSYRRNKQVTTNTYRDGISDPLCNEGSKRVIRGGSWRRDASQCAVSSRQCFIAPSCANSLGFRLCLGPVLKGE